MIPGCLPQFLCTCVHAEICLTFLILSRFLDLLNSLFLFFGFFNASFHFLFIPLQPQPQNHGDSKTTIHYTNVMWS